MHEYLCRLSAACAAQDNLGGDLSEDEAFRIGDEYLADGIADCHCQTAEDARAEAERGVTWGFWAP